MSVQEMRSGDAAAGVLRTRQSDAALREHDLDLQRRIHAVFMQMGAQLRSADDQLAAVQPLIDERTAISLELYNRDSRRSRLRRLGWILGFFAFMGLAMLLLWLWVP